MLRVICSASRVICGCICRSYDWFTVQENYIKVFYHCKYKISQLEWGCRTCLYQPSSQTLSILEHWVENWISYTSFHYDAIPQNNVCRISSVTVDQDNFQLMSDGSRPMNSSSSPVEKIKLSIALHKIFSHFSCVHCSMTTVAFEEDLHHSKVDNMCWYTSICNSLGPNISHI